jgi:carbon storage regulator
MLEIHSHNQGGLFMLVLSRRLGEEIIIAGHIRVKLVAVQGNRVKLGIVAPDDVTVHREEIHRQRFEFQHGELDEPVPFVAR